MMKLFRITFFTLALGIFVFSGVSPVEAQQQPAHGPGSSGKPVGQYKNDPHSNDQNSAIRRLSDPSYGNAIADWNTSMASALSSYRILLDPSSRAARVAITNCDKPYFDAAMGNMRYIVGKLQDMRRKIDMTQTQVSRLLYDTQQLQDDTIEAQGEPGPPLVGSLVEEAVDLVPIAGKAINAAGDEEARQAQATLYEALQKKRRFRAWIPQIEQIKQQTDVLLSLAESDISTLIAAFQPDACQICGPQVTAETPAQQIVMPPASTLPMQPDLQRVNAVIEDFKRVAEQTAAKALKTRPTTVSPNSNVQPGQNPNDY